MMKLLADQKFDCDNFYTVYHVLVAQYSPIIYMNLLCSRLGRVHVCGRADREIFWQTLRQARRALSVRFYGTREIGFFIPKRVFFWRRAVFHARNFGLKCAAHRTLNDNSTSVPPSGHFNGHFIAVTVNYRWTQLTAGSIMLKLAFTIRFNSRIIINRCYCNSFQDQ